MHKLRRAVRDENDRVILCAEHLPNEWDLTNLGGPMDTQWCDDFHDRLEDACRGGHVMSALADALKLTHTACDDWYKATNYPESHDEVGNENDRIAQVAQLGTGLRCNKVAAAVTLCSRGIPMWFMGAEAGEHRQFLFNRTDVLDLDHYESAEHARHVRAWWRALVDLRRGNARLQGPAPLAVTYAEGQLLAFSRGAASDYVVVANFGGWSGWMPLRDLHLAEGRYAERLNSTSQPYRVENEDTHLNSSAVSVSSDWLHIPDYGVIVLERT
jgi:1,4-alpha-glucan branching enzyme